MAAWDYEVNALEAHYNGAAPAAHQQLVAAPAAGYRLVIERITISNGATAGTVAFEYATGGTQTQIGANHFLGVNANIPPSEVFFPIPEATNFGFTAATCTTYSISCQYRIEEV
jgi:hypothetical protein